MDERDPAPALCPRCGGVKPKKGGPDEEGCGCTCKRCADAQSPC